VSTYESWLVKHNELIKKALELILSFKFRAIIIDANPPFIRIYINNKKIDFYVKEIKSNFIRSVWVSKKNKFDPKGNYLIYVVKGERWLIASGQQIDEKAEYRDSEHQKNVKYLVVPIDVFSPAKTFFKMAKNRYERGLQRRMTEWTQPKSI